MVGTGRQSPRMKFVDTTNISSIEDVNDYLQFSDAGYYTLTVYQSVSVVVGLIGNSLVLYGSAKFNAIEDDNISVLLIEALAISDLLLLIFVGLVNWITLITGRWILGAVGCFLQCMVTADLFACLQNLID